MDKNKLKNHILNKFIYSKKKPVSALLADMSPPEFILISTFTEYEKNNGRHITINELATELNISLPAVSRTLKHLEERQLIKRVTNEDCRRITFVVISEKGKKLFEKNRKKAEALLNKIIESFTADEIIAAMKFQEKLESVILETIN